MHSKNNCKKVYINVCSEAEWVATEGWLQGEVHSVQIKFTINLSKLEKNLHGCTLTLHTVKIIKYK